MELPLKLSLADFQSQAALLSPLTSIVVCRDILQIPVVKAKTGRYCAERHDANGKRKLDRLPNMLDEHNWMRLVVAMQENFALSLSVTPAGEKGKYQVKWVGGAVFNACNATDVYSIYTAMLLSALLATEVVQR